MQYTQEQIFQRLIICKGSDAFAKLQQQIVMQIGVGAVGGFCAEILVRCGIKRFILIDFDKVDISNCNRQIVASVPTVGQFKVDVMKKRMLEINPECQIETFKEKIDGERFFEIFKATKPTIVVDAIDLFQQKCEIIKMCIEHHIVLISSMGAARKSDPSKIQLVNIQQINTCPLAKRVKKTLDLDKNTIIDNICCIMSREPPMKQPCDENDVRLALPSYSVITTLFGVWAAHAVIQHIIDGKFKL